MRHSAILLSVIALPAVAAELDPAAVAAWNQYVAGATVRAEQRTKPGKTLLWIDESHDLLTKVQSGEVVVSPVGAQNPRKLPSGLIHHWIGAVFIPNASLGDVLTVVRDYPRYRDYFPQNVIDSRVIELSDAADRSWLVLRSQSFFVRSALDGDYESRYVVLDQRRLYSVTQTTRIQEVEGYGSPSPHVLHEGEGTGAIWKMVNVNRYVERDGGVYLEIEAIALSRDIPVAVRWAVEPIVRRMSRSSLSTTLRQTEGAVSRRVEASGPKRAQVAFAGR